MAITYVRTMKMQYECDLTDTDMAKLSAKLHEKGFSLVGQYHGNCEPMEERYGYVPKTKSTTNYTVVVDGKDFTTHSWRSDAKKVVKGFNETFPEMNAFMDDRSVDITKKEWIKPKGRYVRLADRIGLNGVGGNTNDALTYEGNMSMLTTLYRDGQTLELKFMITWIPEKIQKKADIEQQMVEIPLEDMGKIQGIVESRLKLKQFGVAVDSPIIECHFDAKTESRSECAPDIIAKVRNARKG